MSTGASATGALPTRAELDQLIDQARADADAALVDELEARDRWLEAVARRTRAELEYRWTLERYRADRIHAV